MIRDPRTVECRLRISRLDLVNRCLFVMIALKVYLVEQFGNQLFRIRIEESLSVNNAFTEISPKVTVVKVFGFIADVVLIFLVEGFIPILRPTVFIFDKLLDDGFSSFIVDRINQVTDEQI